MADCATVRFPTHALFDQLALHPSSLWKECNIFWYSVLQEMSGHSGDETL